MIAEEEKEEKPVVKFSKRGLKKVGIRKPLATRFSKTIKIKI